MSIEKVCTWPSRKLANALPLKLDSAVPMAGIACELVNSVLKAKLPVGVDFVGRPFDEPLLLKIASAYEASTKHRVPPSEFGPLKGEP